MRFQKIILAPEGLHVLGYFRNGQPHASHEILAPCGASFAAVFVGSDARDERAFLFGGHTLALLLLLLLLLLQLGQSSFLVF